MVATAVAVEILARTFDIGQLSTPSRSEAVYGYHEVTGWHPIPNNTARIRSDKDPIDTTVSSDALGIRVNGDTAEKAASAPAKLLVIGDSVTAGYAVEDGETYCARLEDLFSQAGTPVKVYNAGVGGYGTDQSLLRLRMLLPELQPDAVLYMFCGNDLSDNLTIKSPGWTISKPAFALEGGTLELLNSPAMRAEAGAYCYIQPAEEGYQLVRGGAGKRFFKLRDWLQRNSLIYRNLKVALRLSPQRGTQASILDPVDLEAGARRNAATAEYQLRLLRALIREMKSEFGLFFAAGTIPPDETRHDYPDRLFKTICEEEEIPFLDVGPFLGDGTEIRFENDPHWNPVGHQRAAEALFHGFRQLAFPPPAAE